MMCMDLKLGKFIFVCYADVCYCIAGGRIMIYKTESVQMFDWQNLHHPGVVNLQDMFETPLKVCTTTCPLSLDLLNYW